MNTDPEWIVYRCDDNGNTFEVARYATQAEAEAAVVQFTARGHKQTYWATKETISPVPVQEVRPECR